MQLLVLFTGSSQAVGVRNGSQHNLAASQRRRRMNGNGVNGSVRRCDFELSINWHSTTVDGVGGFCCAVNMDRA